LKSLSRSNDLWNIDEFEGNDGGPPRVVEIPGIRTITGRLGNFSTEIPSHHFDVLFSVSVVEHLPTADSICTFFSDGARLLKNGGLMYHAIDIYLQDERFEYAAQRVELYLSHAQQTGLKFIEPPEIDSNIRFRCRYATNPDLSMFGWNQVAPSLADLRINAQSVSLKMALRKES
jgi:hypothetical protein